MREREGGRREGESGREREGGRREREGGEGEGEGEKDEGGYFISPTVRTPTQAITATRIVCPAPQFTEPG